MTSAEEFDLGEADRELGSPILTVESGWLLGLMVGLIALVIIGRRRRRAVRKPEASDSPAAH